MVVYKKRTYRKKRSRRPRRGVTSNAKAIEGIKRTLKSQRNQWGLAHESRSQNFGDNIIALFPAAVATSYSPAWSNWGPNSEIAALAGRFTVGNIHCGLQVTAFTEELTTFCMYHIKLRPETAATTIEDLGRDLATIGSNNEYSMRGAFNGTQGVASSNSHVQLNPRCFEVKQKWTFTVGSSLASGPAQQISTNMRDSIYNLDFTINMGNQVFGSPNGLALDLDADAYRNENLNYLILFSDQTTVDLESPSYSLMKSCILTAKA